MVWTSQILINIDSCKFNRGISRKFSETLVRENLEIVKILLVTTTLFVNN